MTTTYYHRSGITRQLDNLGRLVVPIDIRRRLGFEPAEKLEFTVDGDNVHIQLSQTGARGVTRKIDRLGRVIIPVHIRKRLDIEGGTEVDISIHADGVSIRKAVPRVKSCFVTGATEDVVTLLGGAISLSTEGFRLLFEEYKTKI